MDKESVVQSFSLYPEVEGAFAWDDTSELVFYPESLNPQTRYQVSLGPAAQSKDGLQMGDEYNFAFSTVSPLLVTQINPPDGASDLRGDTDILLAFNHPVVPIHCVGEYVQADGECLELPLTFSPSVLGRAEWVNTSLYRFTPISGWGAGERYNVTLSSGVASLSGAVLQETFNWSFETAPPRITTVFPESGFAQVRLASAISVTFNTPMDQAITGREFNLVSEDERIVPGTIRWRDNGAVLIFTPTDRLVLDSDYTVQVSPRARARTSAPLENPRMWSFHTVSEPQLVRYTPDDNETLVGLNRPVQLNFAGAIDEKTLADNVKIDPEPEDERLYTYYDKISNVYTLQWERQPRTEYCVEVLSGVSDIYGHTLEESTTLCFVTGDLPVRLELPMAADMVAMNADEPSVLYLGARNADDISFVLSQYDESTFIRQDSSAEGDVLREWVEDFDLSPNQSQLVPLYLRRLRGALPTGLYGLEWQIPGQNYGPRRLGIAVVDRHISIKLTRDEAVVWVTDLESGSPITRTAVRLIDNQGLLIAGGTTDDEGLARIPISPVDNLWNRVAAVIGAAGEPGFGIAMTGWSGEASPWEFGLNFAPGLSPASRIFLETDRELYRPEQTLHFHGLVREGYEGTYQVPGAETQVDVTLQTIDMRPIYSETLTLSEFGSFSGSIHLEEMIALGEYVLNASIHSQNSDRATLRMGGGSKRVSIEAYHKSPFQVDVFPDVMHIRQGEVVQFHVAADYFSGGSLSNGSVDWELRAAPYAMGESERLSKLGWQWNSHSFGASSKVITQGKSTLDESGGLLLEFPADLTPLGDSESVESQRWTLNVRVTDRSQLPVSDPVAAVGKAIVHQADLYLGLRPKARMVRARERVEIEVRAVDWDGEPLPEREITAMLVRRTWASDDGENTPGRAIDSIVSETTLTTDADGDALAVFNPPRSGNYVVRLESEDAQGHDVAVETTLWVSGDDSFGWHPTSDVMALKPDAQVYDVGESAQILVPVPFTGTYQLLLTVERDSLLKVKRFVFDQPNPVIELPIEEAYAPNVYVSALAVRPATDEQGPDVRAGYVNVSVSPSQYLLDVSIEGDLDTYSPGEEARLTVRTSDHEGQPVDAEVSLSIVDKAILDLKRGPEAQTIVEAFYGEHPLSVSSGHTLLVLMNRWGEEIEASSGYAFSEGPAGLGGGDTVPTVPGIRQDFPDTAFWDSALRTGPDGQVEVSVKLPDSLTTWRVRATAATKETEIGVTEREIEVRQPLSVQPVVPEFLVVGDRTEIVAVVHNRTPSDFTALVTIEAQGVAVEGNLVQEVVVPAMGRMPVLWALNASQDSLPSATLSFSAEAGDYRDVMTLDDPIPIHRWDMPDVKGASGVLREAGERIEVFHVPMNATMSSALRLSVETSLTSGLIDQMEGLLTQPSYGATDAVTSWVLTSLATLQAVEMQDVSVQADVKEMEALVTEALECIQMRQNPDGGWGWWRDWSNLHMTSYVAMTLLRARSAGFPISDRVIDRSLDYIETMMTRALQTDSRYPHFALSIRVLSQADRPWPSGAATILYRDRQALGVAGRFHLALALGAVDPSDPRVAMLLGDLQSEARITATGAHWEDVDSQHWSTDIQVTALAVEALTVLSPDDPLLPQAVRWLMSARRLDRWPTVYETAWASTSLATYMAEYDSATGTFDFDVSLNGHSLLDDSSTREDRLGAGLTFDLPLGEELRHGINLLSLTRKSGSGGLFYASSLHLFQPIDEVSSQSRGMSINRQYCQMSRQEILGSETLHVPVATECLQTEKVAVGDIIEVRLTVVIPATRHYVRVRDLFPAGFVPIQYRESDVGFAIRSARAVNNGLLDQAEGVGVGGALDSGPVEWLDPFERREYHESQADFFARQLSPGTYQARYWMRAKFPGTYHSLPATVSELYFPEVWGGTEAVTIEVLPCE